MALKLRSRGVIFLHDLMMVVFAWLGAFWLYFNLSIPPDFEMRMALQALPFVMCIQAIFFFYFGLYRGIWRFASIPDLIRIIRAVGWGVPLIAVSLFVINRLAGVPRSIIPLYMGVLILLLAAPRVLYRLWKDQGNVLSTRKRALIIGAGQTGELLVRDLFRAKNAKFVPVAFVDDDPHKGGLEIHGLRVRGNSNDIPYLIDILSIDILLLAVPSATDQQMRRIVECCESVEVPFLTLPSVQDMLVEQVAGTLREVAIEDLLGRASVHLDHERVQNHLQGKCILVTGGGGSIGAELCQQIARFTISELIILERSEFNLYTLEQTLRRSFPYFRFTPLLGDVTDKETVCWIIEKYRPHIIFHAAAYKHVPLLENQIRQAVRNNIIGTYIVAEAALASGVEEFVLISTDKAVRPSNVMGATKRVAEMLVQSMSQKASTRFITVRFGNVLDSAGSVVPLFREQIRMGGPVTVTHPEMTRYFMTIPEACQLIMQATAMGQGGEIFVLDMGEPVRISYLAEQMIRLSGKKPGKDIHIEYIGLRPGEKLTEELFLESERPLPTACAKLHLAASSSLELETMLITLKELVVKCQNPEEEAILATLYTLVPELALAKTNSSSRVLSQIIT